MTPQTSELVQLDLDSIRRSVTGPVIGPDDAEYDAARTVMLGGVDARPAVIVRVADTDDVRTVIRLARETGLDLAVRSGGHSGAAHGTAEGGIVLDVRDLNGLEIDEASKTAWAGSGLTAAEYTIAAAELGLATGFGDTGSVGLGGITTGGGIGYLVRKHGLTDRQPARGRDRDGRRRGPHRRRGPRAGPVLGDPRGRRQLRGGDAVQVPLHPVPQTVGGMLFLPATADTIAGFVAAAQAAPDSLSTIANVMPCPPMPFVPEAQHGKLVIFGLLCWAGPVEEGQAALAPFRALARRSPTCSARSRTPRCTRRPSRTTTRSRSRGPSSSTDSTAGVAETILEHLEASDAAMRAAQIRALGGAMARVDPADTAFALRDRPSWSPSRRSTRATTTRPAARRG